MAGDSRIQGAGPRLSLLDGDLAAVLQQVRFRGASIRPAVIVGPGATAGRAIVENECSPGNPYEVASDLNFRPGTPVLLGSFAGSGEEVILARAPADKAGAASNPVRLTRGTIRRAAPASTCPPAITGRSYLACYNASGDDVLHCWRYTDGSYIETLGTFDYSAEDWSITLDPRYQRAHPDDVIILKVRFPGSDGIATWDPEAETMAVLDCNGLDIGGPLVVGEGIYFSAMTPGEVEGQELWLYQVGIGASGLLDIEAARVGTPLVDLDGVLSVGEVLSHSGGETFQVAAFDFSVGDDVVVPYFLGGGWSLGAGREVLAGPGDTGNGGNGFNVLGTKSLRSTYTTPGQGQLGLMPAGPGSPEIGLIPAEWGGTFGDPSVNPAGNQVALYPYRLPAEVEVWPLVRLPIQGTAYNGACTLHRMEVEAGPVGQPPEVMLCRD